MHGIEPLHRFGLIPLGCARGVYIFWGSIASLPCPLDNGETLAKEELRDNTTSLALGRLNFNCSQFAARQPLRLEKLTAMAPLVPPPEDEYHDYPPPVNTWSEDDLQDVPAPTDLWPGEFHDSPAPSESLPGEFQDYPAPSDSQPGDNFVTTVTLPHIKLPQPTPATEYLTTLMTVTVTQTVSSDESLSTTSPISIITTSAGTLETTTTHSPTLIPSLQATAIAAEGDTGVAPSSIAAMVGGILGGVTLAVLVGMGLALMIARARRPQVTFEAQSGKEESSSTTSSN